jgi:hypothetical protein
MVSPSMRLKWYKRKDVQEAIVDAAQDREIAVKFGDSGFGKRPDVLKYPKDVFEFAKHGATSFHCSEELWSNPLNIVTGMRKKELDSLRIGWDLILDLDCPVLEFSQIAAKVLIDALKYYGIKNFSVKFSGNHGFHIGVPFWVFPESVKGFPVKDLFPEGPRKIASFLQERSREVFADKMLEFHSLNFISKKLKKPISSFLKNNVFDPYSVVSVDTVLIASRHLYRMPYSFNEKSGLVSVPIKPENILSFDKKDASFEKVVVDLKFLQKKDFKTDEAKRLFVEAFDSAYSEKTEEDFRKAEKKSNKYSVDAFSEIKEAISEDCFPPCIKNILKGLIDGRKRALFILINFLSSIGWDFEKMKEFLIEWNKRNEEPLRDSILFSQINFKLNKEAVLPPNCNNNAYMKEMQVCCPDGLCRKVKNPVNYAVFRNILLKKNRVKKD